MRQEVRLKYVIDISVRQCEGVWEFNSTTGTHMTPPPKHIRQEKSVIIAGFCWDSESEIQPFLTPMSGRIPGEKQLDNTIL